MPITNPLRERLMSGKCAVGALAVLGSLESLELAALAGFDFVAVDWQHGSFDQASMRNAARALDAAGCSAMARPPAAQTHLIEWLMDMGYRSLLLPMIDTADQARAAVSAALYPPRGMRSQARCRAAIHGGPDYRETCNDAALIVAMLETPAAVAQAGDIAAVDGVDCVFIGAGDLASTMGATPESAEFERSIDQVLHATLDAGKIAAIVAHDVDAVRRRAEQGFRLFTFGSDMRILSNGYEDAVTQLAELRA
jgi:2-keto-3-deoxy-L-rhamnonate aldolase RhmA